MRKNTHTLPYQILTHYYPARRSLRGLITSREYSRWVNSEENKLNILVTVKGEGDSAFKKGNYDLANSKYSSLIDSLRKEWSLEGGGGVNR